MAWCREATSHYLSQYWPDLCRQMASLGLNELMLCQWSLENSGSPHWLHVSLIHCSSPITQCRWGVPQTIFGPASPTTRFKFKFFIVLTARTRASWTAGHVSYPADSPIATKLRLCNSLLSHLSGRSPMVRDWGLFAPTHFNHSSRSTGISFCFRPNSVQVITEKVYACHNSWAVMKKSVAICLCQKWNFCNLNFPWSLNYDKKNI